LSESSLSLKPIGIVRTSLELKFDAPHQPDKTSRDENIIELLPGHDFEQALSDLKGFDYIWLIWWFHKNKNWKPMVLPPRGKEKRRGVFATRSPHRPNPIGLTAVPLISITGRKITIGPCDLVDGTPILDIKPYITSADCFSSARQGWIEEIEKERLASPEYTVTYSKKAASQLKWLKSNKINFIERAEELLKADPSPHRTRRITKSPGGLFRMGCGAWRMYFSVKGGKVAIKYIEPGYPPKSLLGKDSKNVPHCKEQLAFLKEF
jgi:tRNA-Thr(GGU) m(6)t(6)A37 methyltransferase TsaA